MQAAESKYTGANQDKLGILPLGLRIEYNANKE